MFHILSISHNHKKTKIKVYLSLFLLIKDMNKKIVLFSILGLGFLALTFFVDWLFIIGAVILVYLNQKELMKKPKK